MPSFNALKAGRAVIELSFLTGDVEKKLKRLQAKMRDFGTALKSIGSRSLAASSAISAPFIAAIKHAGDAQEILSRFDAVFGEQTRAATNFADDLAASVGRSTTEIKNGLSSFQAFFVGLGFASDEARGLSQKLQALSIDFASFNNLSDAEAQRRFISALSGSSEVLDMYGINIKVAALDQELLRMGFKGGALAASEEQKALARLNIIMQSMTDQGAVGDAARTSGSFSNQLKRLQGATYELSVAIGTSLIPSATKFLQWMNSSVGKIAELNRAFPGLAEGIFNISIAAGVASGAVIAFGVALTVASAHPIIAGIAAVSAVVAALAVSLGDAEAIADRLARAMARLAGVDMEVFDKIREFESKMGKFKFEQAAPEITAAVTGAKATGDGSLISAARGLFDQASVKAQAAVLRMRFEAMPLNGMAERAMQEFERMRAIGDEGQRLEDEIARARIANIEDNGARERAMIEQQHAERMRQLKADGLVTPALIQQLEELRDIQLQAIDADGGARAVQNQQALFDARFARQIYGAPRNEELSQLRKIASNTDPRKAQQGGVPVI